MTNPTSPSPRRTAGAVLAMLALAVFLAVAAPTVADATEATEAPATEAPAEDPANAGAADGESDKLTISDNPHDQFGLVLFALMGLAALALGANAVKQLRGERPQADGSYRWR